MEKARRAKRNRERTEQQRQARERRLKAQEQQALSRSESSFVLMIRAVWFLWEMTFGICAATRLEKMMGLCTAQAGAAGASALYARQASFAWACCCAAGLLINPLVASLSDTFGRKPFLLIGPAWNTIRDSSIPLGLSYYLT